MLFLRSTGLRAVAGLAAALAAALAISLPASAQGVPAAAAPANTLKKTASRAEFFKTFRDFGLAGKAY